VKLTARVGRTLRLARAVSHALVDRHHPLLVHLVAMRRCGLSCAYCNEYDAVSKPVSLELMRARIDRVADLGTAAVTLRGGEPLSHPDIDQIIRHGRARGLIVSLHTGGLQLSLERIEALNRAGVDHLQISVDNVEPDQNSTKSLRLLEPTLRWLSDRANFSVSIRSVLGSGAGTNPEDVLVVARSARELGFLTSLGIVHEGRDDLRPLAPREMQVYDEIRSLGGSGILDVRPRFQDQLARGRPNAWSCRADEHGLVHYCADQRGRPGIPLDAYTIDDIRREYDAMKPCAPFCTVSSAQRIALADSWRSPQRSRATVPRQPADAPSGGADPALAG
jgi:pyruvate-formate lyase-activating enzyme